MDVNGILDTNGLARWAPQAPYCKIKQITMNEWILLDTIKFNKPISTWNFSMINLRYLLQYEFKFKKPIST
jgi:hypothetical protein